MNMVIREGKEAQSIAENIRKQYESGKLKDKKIKDFMKDYYDGDPSSDCPNGCKANCLLDCYIDIHQSLIDDSGKTRKFKELYLRDSQWHCCGRLIANLNGKKYCTVCGTEHK